MYIYFFGILQTRLSRQHTSVRKCPVNLAVTALKESPATERVLLSKIRPLNQEGGIVAHSGILYHGTTPRCWQVTIGDV